MRHVDLAVIGGGSAGMAAALAARRHGVEDIVILERSSYLGGVLRQCIHNGFGVHRFQEDLTGTQYASRFVRQIEQAGIEYMTETFVLELSAQRVLTAISPSAGLFELEAGAVVLATGCRERPRGALLIPGSRPAGIVTAGTAQRYMNLEGYLVGKRIVILGSGDIGLIMARQFVLEGAQVLAVAEVMPYSGGLARNIVQCLEDFDIPLHYSTTVTRIVGEGRLEGVYLSRVDEYRRPLPGTERYVPCDTLILSVGLIPENELASAAGIELSAATGGCVVDDALQTGMEGVFACGNALHVHDLVDFVTEESERAGEQAARYLCGENAGKLLAAQVVDGPGIRGVVPQRIRAEGDEMVELLFRPTGKFLDRAVAVYAGEECVLRKRFRVLTPGEMCRLTVRRAALSGTVKVQVEEP